MPDVLHLEGFIKDVKYRACVTPKDIIGKDLAIFDPDDFDINAAPTWGLIRTQT
jgi:hypothetical protein